jgi:juvenile hormone epoxide hydrolase
LEKFSTWTDLAYQSLPDGGLSSKVKFTMDEMLTDVMIYWVNNCITTSMRLYSESFTVKTLGYQIDE